MNLLGLLQERQRIVDRARRRTARVPRDHHGFSDLGKLAGGRHDENRPRRIQDESIRDARLGGIVADVLPDDDQVGIARMCRQGFDKFALVDPAFGGDPGLVALFAEFAAGGLGIVARGLGDGGEHFFAHLRSRVTRHFRPDPRPTFSRRAEALENQGNLAYLYWRVGRHLEAEPLLRNSLAGTEARWGPDHFHTWSARNNLGALLIAGGDGKAAEPLMLEVVAKRTEESGAKSPAALSARSLLAQAVKLQEGRSVEAIALYRDLLADTTETFREDHPTTAGTQHSLGVLLAETRGRVNM